MHTGTVGGSGCIDAAPPLSLSVYNRLSLSGTVGGSNSVDAALYSQVPSLAAHISDIRALGRLLALKPGLLRFRMRALSLRMRALSLASSLSLFINLHLLLS